MKLTEFIKELQSIYDELGECDVIAHDTDITGIYTAEEPDCDLDTVFIY